MCVRIWIWRKSEEEEEEEEEEEDKYEGMNSNPYCVSHMLKSTTPLNRVSIESPFILRAYIHNTCTYTNISMHMHAYCKQRSRAWYNVENYEVLDTRVKRQATQKDVYFHKS